MALVKTFGMDPQVMDHIQEAECPQHRVILTKPVQIGATEITIGQFKLFATIAKFRMEAEVASADGKAPT